MTTTGSLKNQIGAIKASLDRLSNDLNNAQAAFDKAAREADRILSQSGQPIAATVRDAINAAGATTLRASDAVNNAAHEAERYASETI